jgi:uncharacterized cysteine cluster protein YcgN (CxxCxxCC family)
MKIYTEKKVKFTEILQTRCGKCCLLKRKSKADGTVVYWCPQNLELTVEPEHFGEKCGRFKPKE